MTVSCACKREVSLYPCFDHDKSKRLVRRGVRGKMVRLSCLDGYADHRLRSSAPSTA